MQPQNVYCGQEMDSLAFCCGRRCSVHEVSVQPSLKNDTLFAYTGQSDQKMIITLHLPGKLVCLFLNLFHICFLVEHYLLSLHPLIHRNCLVFIQMALSGRVTFLL